MIPSLTIYHVSALDLPQIGRLTDQKGESASYGKRKEIPIFLRIEKNIYIMLPADGGGATVCFTAPFLFSSLVVF